MKKTPLVNYVSLLLSGGCLVLLVILLVAPNGKRIGYVDNAVILNEYHGVKDSRSEYQQKVKAWRSEVDSLQAHIEREMQHFKVAYADLSEKERQLMSAIIKEKQEKFYAMRDQVDQRIAEEDQKVAAAIITQIDAYMKEYGEQEGYDYIIGLTDAGNLLFANEENDLTHEVLDGLNRKYEGS